MCCADDRAKNLRPKRNIRTAMNHEVMMYAIAQVGERAQSTLSATLTVPRLLRAQKEQLGFDKAVEECKYRESSCQTHTHYAQRDAQLTTLSLFFAGMSRYGVSPNVRLATRPFETERGPTPRFRVHR